MELAYVSGCTAGPLPTEIEDGPFEEVVCDEGRSGIRVGYFRAPAGVAAFVIFEALEPIVDVELIDLELYWYRYWSLAARPGCMKTSWMK